MSDTAVEIRNAHPQEFGDIGRLMVSVYSQLEGFPQESDQPEYYRLLANVGELTQQPETELLVAVSPDGKLLGAVVYFGDMADYGSGGTAPEEADAAGFRLLAVDPGSRGRGVGQRLSMECIARAKRSGRARIVIHTTQAMRTAWRMYEKLGFRRAEDLDFMQDTLPVFGFRLSLDDVPADRAHSGDDGA